MASSRDMNYGEIAAMVCPLLTVKSRPLQYGSLLLTFSRVIFMHECDTLCGSRISCFVIRTPLH